MCSRRACARRRLLLRTSLVLMLGGLGRAAAVVAKGCWMAPWVGEAAIGSPDARCQVAAARGEVELAEARIRAAPSCNLLGFKKYRIRQGPYRDSQGCAARRSCKPELGEASFCARPRSVNPAAIECRAASAPPPCASQRRGDPSEFRPMLRMPRCLIAASRGVDINTQSALALRPTVQMSEFGALSPSVTDGAL